MKEIKGTLVERIKRTAQVESFRFNLPEDVEFLPGQFLQVIFDEENRGNKVLNKYLSFSSTPGKDYIEVTKKLSESDFSSSLKRLKEGDKVLFKIPLGNCVFLEDYKKIGFLVGGIGITPVISIIEYICEKGLDTDVCLLYSNKTEQEIAFKQELDHWRKKNENIKILYAVTKCQPQDEECVFGGLNKDIVSEKMADFKDRRIFIYGPPGMVTAMKDVCSEIGCDEKQLKTENFVGY
ncbi:MAG: FAD-dependent oxidoreductase [PVC group bacterium]|nr:FAD-dependent oxidoreductase [PVC group bacterium]